MEQSIQAWLNVKSSRKALEFYKQAFSAIETYCLDMGDDGVVAKLSVVGAEFWIGEESPDHKNFSPESLGGATTRMVLITDSPEKLFDRALKAGASQIFPVSTAHGWKLGRVVDPFGHHWEIGHPVEN
ncbi:hypothetical protein WSM22_24220 [Cytophagales bacterium WSM2-2]|nr:hypothetical protein WSM22_24220 [Cytophagales bacterium WSM2-2]